MALTAQVAIVGGGLAGLHAAVLLEERGIDYVLLEARPAPGGRLQSEPHGSSRFDLGATWYWPEFQPELADLVRDLGLASFEQPERGDMLVERSASGAPLRGPGYASSPPSMRLVGGMAALVDALARRVPPARVRLGARVRHVRREGAAIEVGYADGTGATSTVRARQVMLALPPRLAATTIAFTPPLPPELQRAWQRTPTWMAPHAKYLAVYDEPFWRGQGLSGEARSAVGPMGEIHDASHPEGHAALFGFLAIPVQMRTAMGDQLLAECRRQFVRLFGPRAATPRFEVLKDWARDEYTATDADAMAASNHAAAPPMAAAIGPWQASLAGIASEFSPLFPGYVAGAVDAAVRGVAALTTDVIGGSP